MCWLAWGHVFLPAAITLCSMEVNTCVCMVLVVIRSIGTRFIVRLDGRLEKEVEDVEAMLDVRHYPFFWLNDPYIIYIGGRN